MYQIIDSEVICKSDEWTPRKLPANVVRKTPNIGDRLYAAAKFNCDCGCGHVLYFLPQYPEEYWEVKNFTPPEPIKDPSRRIGKLIPVYLGEFQFTDVLMEDLITQTVTIQNIELGRINVDLCIMATKFGAYALPRRKENGA